MAAAIPIKEKPKNLSIHVKIVVGAVAGIIGTLSIFPVDMVKTRLQASKGSTFRGPFDCAKQLLAKEGVRGFYRGLPVNLIGVTPEKAIKLAANETFRELLENEDGSIDLAKEMLAGASAGFCQVIATNPMELLKIRMQMQATLPQAERQSTVQVIRSLGIRGVYQGTPATLLRDVCFFFFSFFISISI